MRRLLIAWTSALRMARRDVLRSRGRSVLVAVMVGTPVLLTVVLSTLVATASVSPKENVAGTMGGAQAIAHLQGGQVRQAPDAGGFSSTEPSADDADAAVRLRALTGARIVPVVTGVGTIQAGAERRSVSVTAVDTRARVVRPMISLDSGRLPRTAGEAVVSPGVVDDHPHGRIDVGTGTGRTVSLRIVGVGRADPYATARSARTIVVFPGVLPGLRPQLPSGLLIDRSSPVTWDEVKQLNKAGYSVESRHVLEHPPTRAEQYPDMLATGTDAGERAVLTIAVTAIVLEVVLLAGPAFAVGVRRQRRELALLAAAGGAPADVRRVVLAQAVVLGMLASLVGAVLGVIASRVAVAVLPSVTRWTFGPFDLSWISIVAALILGSAAALVAAYVPATQVARQEVSAVLAGRRGTVRTRAGWPVLGVALIVVGTVLCFTRGIRSGGEIYVSAATVVIVLGTVLLTPALIGVLGRVGSLLPLTLRLAVRDTVRSRARSAPAIAAVMAAVAGVTTILIATASDGEQSRRDYLFSYPMGTAVVHAAPGDLPQAIGAARAATGGAAFTPLMTASSPSQDTSAADYVDVTVDSDQVSGALVVASPATLRRWGVRLTGAQRDELESGTVLVGDPRMLKSDRVEITATPNEGTAVTRRLGAAVADLGLGKVPQNAEPVIGAAVISPARAAQLQLPTRTDQAIEDPSGPVIDKATQGRLADTLSGIDPNGGGITVERGYDQNVAGIVLLLFGLGGLAVLVGTLSATGLALSDARPDFATLAAVGAAPSTRRRIAAGQAIVLGGVGAVLGVGVGFVPGLALTWPLTTQVFAGGGATRQAPVIDIPWVVLTGLVIGVPALAALLAAATTRSRLTIARRLAQ